MDDLPTSRRRAAAPRRIAVPAAILVLCALLALVSTATADPRPADPHFGARETVAAGGPWAELTRLADAYWSGRGRRGGCPATVWIYTDSHPDTAAIGQTPGCSIGLNRTWLRWVRAAQRTADRYGRRARLGGAHPIAGRAAIQRHLLAQLCLNVVHERGHNLGLEHSSDPRSVMYWRADRPPAECRAWAGASWPRFARLSW